MTHIRIYYRKRGGHYHCRVFTSQIKNGTYAKNGDLCFDEREFPDVKLILSHALWIEEEAYVD